MLEVSPVTVNQDQDQLIQLIADVRYDKKTMFYVPFGYSGMMLAGEKKSPLIYDKEQSVVRLLQEMGIGGMPPASFLFFKQEARMPREFAAIHIPFVDGLTGRRGECGLHGRLRLGIWDEMTMVQQLERLGGGFTEENLQQCILPEFRWIVRRVVTRQLQEKGFDYVFAQPHELGQAVFQQAVPYFQEWGLRLLQVDIAGLRCPELEGDEEENALLSGGELALQLQSARNGVRDEALRERLGAIMNELCRDRRNFADREHEELVQLIREMPLSVELGEENIIREYLDAIGKLLKGETV